MRAIREGTPRGRTDAIRACVTTTRCRRPRKRKARFGIAGSLRTPAADERETHREDPQHVRGYAEGERRGRRIVRASRDGTRGACAVGHERTSARTCTAGPFSGRPEKRRFAADIRRSLRAGTVTGAKTPLTRAARQSTSFRHADRRSIEATGRHSEWRAPPDGSAVHESRPDRLTVAVA